jgi:hypothetical protein
MKFHPQLMPTQRTADRRALHFLDDFHTSTASDARSRPPSLILFSLDVEALFMRELGFILLVLGFAAICWFSMVTHPPARSVIVSRYKHLPNSSEMYSLEDVQREIRGAVFDSFLYCRFFVIPGTMMLVGGFLVSKGPRTDAQRPATPNI